MQEDSGERCEMQFKRVEILCIYAHAKLVVIAQQIIGSRGVSQCVKSPFFVQKFKLMEKLSKWSIWIFVSKLTFFDGEKY